MIQTDHTEAAVNVDRAEIEKFGSLAHQWWDEQGQFRTLHQLNPVRLDWIVQQMAPKPDLSGLQVLDVGCGGGILTESLARQGKAAAVLGIDLAEQSLRAAKLHALTAGDVSQVQYQAVSVEALATQQPEHYDLVTCMEMLEHVPDPASILRACGRLCKPGGTVVLSTINRTARAFAMAIVGGEFVLNLLPRGTHSYEKFITPAELQAYGEAAGLTVQALTGVQYLPWAQRFRLQPDVRVNYLMALRK